MKTFIAVVIAMLFFTSFAVSNTSAVSIKIASFSFSTPLSLALIIPVGLALLIFSLVYLRERRKAELIIRDLEDNVEKSQQQILVVTKRTHELEIENRKLKIKAGNELDEDELSL